MMHSKYPLTLMLFWLFFTVFGVQANEVAGLVVSVHDGDTLTLLLEGRQQLKIRLAQIDAPELNQDFGRESQRSLAEMVAGKPVITEVETVDQYGRTVGRILLGPLDVNREQIRRGMAWAYRQYLHDASLLVDEALARQTHRGLWSQPDPIPPWDFRHADRKHGRNARFNH